MDKNTAKTRRIETPAPRPTRGRRLAIGILAVLAAAGVVWRIAGRAVAVDFPATPDQNVLLITIDTLRGDALGCDEWYVADLDAIAGGGVQQAVLRGLAGLGGRLLVDAAVTAPERACWDRRPRAG